LPRPDGGLKQLQNVLSIQSTVSDAPKIAAQQLLGQVGVPRELLTASDQVQMAVTQQLLNGGQAVAQGVDHMNNEIQKAAPPATKGNVQFLNIKLCSPFGC